MEQPICSITLDPIVEAGMTCFGSIYEYSAISAWLTKNDTDPLTGQICPTKFVRKIDINGLGPDDIKKISKDARKSLNLWCHTYRAFAPIPSKYEALARKYKELNSTDSIDTPTQWLNHNIKIREKFLTKSNKAYLHKCTYGAPKLCLDFVDLSYIVVAPKEMNFHRHNFHSWARDNIKLTDKNGRSFKSQDFNFNNLSTSIFAECDFSRCTFIGCDLTNVTFIKCTFIGEEVCFYRSFGRNIAFIDCRFEYVTKWVTTRDVNEAAKILQCRHLSGSYQLNPSEKKIIVSCEKVLV